jgi:glutathione synthase/RimK-type ligase-like ATP-grasp enzyme
MFSRASSLAASTIIHVCAISGIKVFPRLDDYWHFDDKIAQKYIFEALDIPRPDTHVFFDAASALSWLRKAGVPIVAKLKSGAGSINVSLIKTLSDGEKYIRRMFGRGVPATDNAVKDIVTKVRNHRAKRDWVATLKRLPTTLGNLRRLRNDLDWERGYCYFQEFVENNDHDTRITVIGDRAFAFRRGVRPGDFRASGSNLVDFDPKGINLACVELAFKAAKRLGVSCVAFDFIERSEDGSPLVVEMSFAFKPEAVFGCPGHWRADLSWQEGQVWPQDAILEDFLSGTRG